MANPKSKKLKQKQEANPGASGSQNLLTFFRMGNSRKRLVQQQQQQQIESGFVLQGSRK